KLTLEEFPPPVTTPAGCPGTPTTRSARHPLSTHIPRVSCRHKEPSLHFAPPRCLTSCTPLLVSARQTFRRLSSEAHVIVLPPSAARASPPSSPRPKVNSPPHPLSTQIPSSS